MKTKSDLCPPTSNICPSEHSERLPLGACTLAWLLGTYVTLRAWLATKHVCAWCVGPRPLSAKPVSRFSLRGWMRGNPISKNVTHGICPACRAKFFIPKAP